MERHRSVFYNIYVNPDSGPPATENTDFTAGFALLKQNGNANHLRIFGYVPTGYGAISEAIVKSDIDKYYTFWPNDIGGILLDQMDNVTGHETYYQNITDYIHDTYGSNHVVVGNPGAATTAPYINTVDEIQIAETEDYPTFAAMQSATMNGAFNKNKFHIGIHSVTTYNAPLISQLSTIAGNLYVTTDVLANPYDTLSIYLENLATQAENKHVNKRLLNILDPTGIVGNTAIGLEFDRRL